MRGRLAGLLAALGLAASCTGTDGTGPELALVDESRRDALVAEVREVANDPFASGVLVPLEAFFDGNGDIGSIAPNLASHPGTEAIYAGLVEVRERPEVDAVLVDVLVEYEGPLPEGVWPFGQAVIVVTSASPPEVDGWLDNLGSSESFAGLWSEPSLGLPTRPSGFDTVVVWWD